MAAKTKTRRIRPKKGGYAPQHENDPTPERVRQAGDVVDDFKTDSGRRARRLGSILDHMLSHGMIDAYGYGAATKACQQNYLGGLTGAGAIDFSRAKVDGGGADTMEIRMENAQAYAGAMGALHPRMRVAFEQMVLFDKHPEKFGQEHFGYRDKASARAASYSWLRVAIADLDLHYTGGKRPNNDRSRTLRPHDARPGNRPDLREKDTA